ncbi:YbbR-like domain-containing protein [uncultured Croceitalea sp.]|uniref:CdaR family protein n=1 Tax=uncultured Croceitalea sp. TaxID=1798908 RepID=UPI003305E995
MFKKIFGGLNQRKVKVFSVFLLCSTLAWTISQLSESYESRASFELNFVNFPDTLLLDNTEKKYIGAKLRTSGFQFLSFGINTKKLQVDLSDVAYNNEKYYLDESVLKPQFEQQFSNNVSLIELERDKLFVDLYQVVLKEIPIKRNINLNLSPNHILKGKLSLNPKVAMIKGPSNELDQINSIETVTLTLNELTDDFSETIDLIQPEFIKHSQMLTNVVTVSGEVERFSEKEFSLPIKVVNEPKGYNIQLFSKTVTLVCKASVVALKDINIDDFSVIVDGSKISNDRKSLNLEVQQKPKDIYSVRLLETKVEYVLQKL